MKKWIVGALHLLGVLLIAHALMLIGADEITTFESGHRTIRSLDRILTLYGADPKPWEMGLPAPLAALLMTMMSWPGWAIFAAIGGVLGIVTRSRD